MSELEPITELLNRWGGGDRESLERVFPLIYGELKAISRQWSRRERGGSREQTTELVNELYLRLASRAGARWSNRAHFFALAGAALRSILVDQARLRGAAKRGSGVAALSFDERMDSGIQAQPKPDLVQVLALEQRYIMTVRGEVTHSSRSRHNTP